MATVIAVAFASCKERESYRCPTCLSTEDVVQWRLGLWDVGSIPVTPELVKVHESRFLHNFLSTNHVHAWKFAHGSDYCFFGIQQLTCALGSRYVSPVGATYETDPKFREFAEAKLRNGSLTKSNFVAMATIPLTGGDPRVKEDADALPNQFSNP